MIDFTGRMEHIKNTTVYSEIRFFRLERKLIADLF